MSIAESRELSDARRKGRLVAQLVDNLGEGGLIHELAASGKTIVFYCAFGERSAMAVQAAQDKGLAMSRHIEGGMSAWAKAGGATG